MPEEIIINWLMDGDVSIQYQVIRDLAGKEQKKLQERIAKEGWGARLLALRNEEGHWGRGFYQPKWTSTHYTLLDLKNLAISPSNKLIKQSISFILKQNKCADGGISTSVQTKKSDACINGMFLNYASYFGTDENHLKPLIDFIIAAQMNDGGFNCHFNRIGAVHSSLHTTISMLEGIREYLNNGYSYGKKELLKAEIEGREFILQHKLYQSHRTGEIINKNMLKLSYPSRWHYDILRALDYFRAAEADYDKRMQPAIDIILSKKRKDGFYPLQAKHPGSTHFEMEPAGNASRWNTLRVLRVLKYFNNEQ